ncbi:ABC transporter ATP-binding protein [Loigolactobacillus backii]|uniref:ABC transporter ATP-binding protein n=1 Tax=Loigolactobacillus backii TaxID=375175 RepID=UPI000F76DE42|nr:ABC transporter ATP-binding protein [Loigolactobacillus backii]MDA5386926.1 ABC transporter ATP-binding protein [Loigolactobacillus backii]MDA5389464.1 ABC transporter ATP-binding protein [Loigolactobacillus backii]
MTILGLEITNLTGGYSRVPVIKDLNFTVPEATIVGLIGLNGAGKSTTIKHIIGLLTPQKGEIRLNGLSLAEKPEAYRQALAYVPETPILYQELTLREHIDLTIMAYDLNHDEAWQRANQLLDKFRLSKRLDWFPANFSKGMQQKVMIVCAFITQASLYIIDEPFTGLDPLAVRDLLQVIAAEKVRGAAVLMSTHVLATAQQAADQFILLNQGKITGQGSLVELQTQYNLPTGNLDDIYFKMTDVANS